MSKMYQDFYSKKAKSENHLARSYYKLEEIQKKYKIFRSSNMRIMDFGASPGSWLEYIINVANEKSRIYAIDIKPLGRNFAEKVKFFQVSVFDFDYQIILNDGGKLNLMLSDMAPNTSGDKELDSDLCIELCHRLLDIAEQVLIQNGTLICKIFQGPEYKEYYARMKSLFNDLRTFKPESSKSDSKEIYLIGFGFKSTK